MPLKHDAALRKDRTSAYGKAPALTHRHFALIAGIISSFPTPRERLYVANVFASRLQETNPKFELARFMAACGAE